MLTKYRLLSFIVRLCSLCFIGASTFLSYGQEGGSQDSRQRVPPGQRIIQDFPLLHFAAIPDVNRSNWTLKVTGDVEHPFHLQWADFVKLDTVTSISDFHCVTGWSRLDNHWQGVRIRDILRMVQPKESAEFVTFLSADDYTTSLPISQCTGDDDILAFRWEGKVLTKENGGPVRVVIPGKYAYKSALWVVALKLTKKQELGYWEKRGYSNSADPWKEERYSK
jgi:DMSO/TMAO reductase YedYZ molybdopterin-dependent catalytic subunit